MEKNILDEGFRKQSYQDENEIERLKKEIDKHSRTIVITRNILLIFSGYFMFHLVLEAKWFDNLNNDLLFHLMSWDGILILMFLFSAIFSFYQPRISFLIAFGGYLFYFLFTLSSFHKNFIPTILGLGLLYFLANGILSSFLLKKNETTINRLKGDSV